MNIRVVAFEPERVDQASSNYQHILKVHARCIRDLLVR